MRGVVHPPPHPLPNRFMFIAFVLFFMDRSGGRVAQSCWYFKEFVNHLHHKIFLILPLLLFNHVDVGSLVIIPYQINYMEYYWHPNALAMKIITVISNQLV